MKQQIHSPHIPPCHKHMVIATALSALFYLAALQHKPDRCRMLPGIHHMRWLSNVSWAVYVGSPPPIGAG